MTILPRLHDASSHLLFLAAGLALVAATGLYLFEVAARYFFNQPTTWSLEAVQYALAVLIFAALPEVTRRSAHVAIDIVPTALPPRFAVPLSRLNAVIGTLACSSAAWIAAKEALKQFDQGLLTNAAHPIPRWWITAIIAVGLASSAIHFLRHSFGRDLEPDGDQSE